MRGLRVALVEQGDFASGTSSRSSRLLHGGLRYLAQGRVGLVRQAGREKTILGRIAPHLSDPLGFIFPSYQGSGWSHGKMRIGVKLYDLLSGVRGGPRSQSLDVRQTLSLLPELESRNLSGAVCYGDGLTSDSRLVLDTLRSAGRHGAGLWNYLRLEKARRSGRRWVCTLHDVLGGRGVELVAACVVNAAGPWADKLPAAAVRLRLTKGVHLVVDRARLPVPQAVVMTEGRRILFAIPWGQRTLLGTTDTDYAGPLDDVRTDPGDVEYLLDVANANFPAVKLTSRDVISQWAGVRPLIATNRQAGPSDISRSHFIRLDDRGWMDAAGGKLTTYRLMAEKAVDQIARFLGRSLAPCMTAFEPLVTPGEAEGLSGVLPPPVSRGAVEHYCASEWAVHLDDVMIRRTSWRHYLDDPSGTASQVAQWMGEILHWDETRLSEELDRYRQTE